MSNKFKLGLILFILGFLGVLTLLTVKIPMDSLPPELIEKFSPLALKFLVLINPTVLLFVAVVVGVLLFEKVGLTVPAISSFLKSEPPSITFADQVKSGVFFGLIAGVLIVLVGLVFRPSIPLEFIELGKKIEITPLARFLYGGLTEEILMRFGFMTLVIWLVFKLTNNLINATYWIGIILSSLLFAVGHFPVAFSAVGNPSLLLLIYILIGNSIAGLVFGWLYWKKGLESAFIAHGFAHVVMMFGEYLFPM